MFTRRMAARAGAVVLAVAAGWVTGRLWGAPAPPSAAVRPAAVADVAAGRVLFMRYCAFCHGADGGGDGLPAKGLVPPPTDLGSPAARRWGEPQLFTKITRGEPGTAMPAWGKVLSENERWQIVAFLRAEVQRD